MIASAQAFRERANRRAAAAWVSGASTISSPGQVDLEASPRMLLEIVAPGPTRNGAISPILAASAAPASDDSSQGPTAMKSGESGLAGCDGCRRTFRACGP